MNISCWSSPNLGLVHLMATSLKTDVFFNPAPTLLQKAQKCFSFQLVIPQAKLLVVNARIVFLCFKLQHSTLFSAKPPTRSLSPLHSPPPWTDRLHCHIVIKLLTEAKIKAILACELKSISRLLNTPLKSILRAADFEVKLFLCYLWQEEKARQ